MKPAAEISDRAKRYRANRQPPAGPKRCTFCGHRKNVGIDHITGDERDGEPENLMYLCKSCNTHKGIMQARNRVGIRTRQYNPHRRPTFSQFRNASLVLLGIEPGNVAEATATVRETSPLQRISFADRIERENPAPQVPTFGQYAHGVAMHQRGQKDEGGKVIHATPPAIRSEYARRIAAIKRGRRSEVPF
jgi:hypothetical protein